MSSIKKFRKLRVQWKILISALVVLFAFSGYMVFANADSSVTVSVTSTTSIINEGATSNGITATMTGTDENNVVGPDSPDNYKQKTPVQFWYAALCGYGEILADASDLSSDSCKRVWVQVPLSVLMAL